MAAILKDRVKESSTSTGTGALTLAGAATGFRTFAAVCAVGDTFRYTVQGVDAWGAPTGEWECGVGTYSAANTITRTTVVDSSNAGAAVNLSAGTKQVWIGMDATAASWVRERLTAARTYYVRTDGSDSNTGLANTSGGAFLTVQKAVDTACSTLNIGTYNVTIQLADGTYGAVNVTAPFQGSGTVTIVGNAGTPANVVVGALSAYNGAQVAIESVRLTSASSFCLYAVNNGVINYSNVEFNTAASAHIRASAGGIVSAYGNYKIVGASPCHWQAILTGCVMVSNRTITITGTPAFSSAFANADTAGSMELYNNTYSGSATGKRYSATMVGTIQTYTAATLPGNSAGTTATGGQFA